MMSPTPAAFHRALLFIGGLALAVLVVAGGAVYAYRHWQRSRTSAHAEATITAQAGHRRADDSAYFFNQGRHYEVARQLDSLRSHAEATPAAALPELPPEPPRQ